MAANAADSQLRFEDHLKELAFRLLSSVAVLVCGGVVGYMFKGQIIDFIRWPLNQDLYYTSPMGGLNFILQICLWVGFIFCLPVLCYNLLRFVEPALGNLLSNPKRACLIVFSSFGLAIAGIAFGYWISLPTALHFLGQVGADSVHSLISADQYLNFILGYLITFAIIFQIPLILLLIDKIRPFGPKGIGKWRKHVIVGAFALAVVLPSAPDPLSQVILALPIILLFEASSVLILARNRKRSKGHKPQETETILQESMPQALFANQMTSLPKVNGYPALPEVVVKQNLPSKIKQTAELKSQSTRVAIDRLDVIARPPRRSIDMVSVPNRVATTKTHTLKLAPRDLSPKPSSRPPRLMVDMVRL